MAEEIVKIKKWVIIFGVPLILSILTAFIGVSNQNTKQDEEIRILQEEMKLKSSATDIHYIVRMVDDSKIQLNRIEKKLDDHIQRSK